jgi:hypothetical protein
LFDEVVGEISTSEFCFEMLHSFGAFLQDLIDVGVLDLQLNIERSPFIATQIYKIKNVVVPSKIP